MPVEDTPTKPQEDQRATGRRRGKGVPFDAEKGREAAKKRWERERAGDAAREQDADVDVLVPASRAAMLKAMIRKAEGGDVQAARLVLEHPVAERRDVLAVLDRTHRAFVRGLVQGDEHALSAVRDWKRLQK
jgi:hypothetical protein